MRKEKEKRRTLSIVHVHAFCNDCDWSTQDYIKGRKMAYNHVNMKKHSVHIEVGYSGTINGRE